MSSGTWTVLPKYKVDFYENDLPSPVYQSTAREVRRQGALGQ